MNSYIISTRRCTSAYIYCTSVHDSNVHVTVVWNDAVLVYRNYIPGCIRRWLNRLSASPATDRCRQQAVQSTSRHTNVMSTILLRICFSRQSIATFTRLYSTMSSKSNSKCTVIYAKLEFGMYPQRMQTEWTHARTVRPRQSVRLDLWRLVLRGL